MLTVCIGLNGLTISPQTVGLPTTAAIVASAVVVSAAGAGVAAVAGYCKALDIARCWATSTGMTRPHLKSKFQVNLPSNWNGKAMMFGGAGYNGVLATGVGNVLAGPTNNPAPLARGYATFGGDLGHQANTNGSRGGTFDANGEALKNFASDAIRKA